MIEGKERDNGGRRGGWSNGVGEMTREALGNYKRRRIDGRKGCEGRREGRKVGRRAKTGRNWRIDETI